MSFKIKNRWERHFICDWTEWKWDVDHHSWRVKETKSTYAWDLSYCWIDQIKKLFLLKNPTFQLIIRSSNNWKLREWEEREKEKNRGRTITFFIIEKRIRHTVPSFPIAIEVWFYRDMKPVANDGDVSDTWRHYCPRRCRSTRWDVVSRGGERDDLSRVANLRNRRPCRFVLAFNV